MRKSNATTERIYAAILRHFHQEGECPSYDEISAATGDAKSNIYRHVDILVKQGRIIKTRDRARGLKLANPAAAQPPPAAAETIDQNFTWGIIILSDDAYEVLKIEVIAKRRNPYRGSIQPDTLKRIYSELGYPVADRRQHMRKKRKDVS